MEKQWNAKGYDQSFDFVSKFGEGIYSYLKPQTDERILDLGCGTGDLADKISRNGAAVMGVDSSVEMVETAKTKYPHIHFEQMDATALIFENEFDAIFSNAVLHWVLDKEKAIEGMHRALKKGGRLVLEFGGMHNIGTMLEALNSCMTKRGYHKNAAVDIWYFPSIGEYAIELEKLHFRVVHAEHFDRDTPLNGEEGMKDWFRMFGDRFFEGISDQEKEEILTEVEDQLKPTHYQMGQWIADYKRLRMVAVKD